MNASPTSSDVEHDDRSEGATSGHVPAVLTVRSLAKAYGETLALRDVSFDVQRGEVRALIGENGAGKSTLVKILSGTVAPDSGSIAIDGRPHRVRSVAAARAAGVATAFQELSLLPNLTVAQNVMLPKLLTGVGGLTSTRANERHVAALLDEFDVEDIRADDLVEDLSLAQRQRVEIVRAASRRSRLLILDEPSAALSDPQWLYRLVERAAAGGTAVLYITHRLAEVRRLCARATVLRNGADVGTVDLARATNDDVFQLMVGAAAARRGAPDARSRDGARRVGLGLRRLAGGELRGVDLDVHLGEVVGVAALEGQGQRELFRMLGGLAPAVRGAVTVDGHAVALRSPAHAQAAGIGFLPEDRRTEGIFPGLSTTANITLPILGALTRFALVDRRSERDRVEAAAARVDLNDRHLEADIATLSGGNQQKALLARVLTSGARHLALFDPTRGVDVGTRQVIYRVIRRFVDAGGSALIHSTDLAELVQLVDRCVVMYSGRIVGELAGGALDEARLVAMATGQGQAA